MPRVKKSIAILLCFFVFLISTACQADGETDIVTEPDNDIRNYDIIPAPPYTPVYNETQIVFTGITIHRDDFLWTEGRDMAWEEDIRIFAVAIYTTHPLLAGFDSLRHIWGEKAEYAYPAFNGILQRVAAQNGISAYDYAHMQEALREIFVERVNNLIIEIPNLTDFEIEFGISEIAAILRDMRTTLTEYTGQPPSWALEVFPIELIYAYDGIYFIGVPGEMEHALYGELIAVNGINIGEILDRFNKVVPLENGYKLKHFAPKWLRYKGVLAYLIADDSASANFTVRGTDGEVLDMEVTAVGRESFERMSYTGEFARHESDALRDKYPEAFFWHKYFPDGSLLYVRGTSLFGGHAHAINTGINKLNEKLLYLEAYETIDKLVIDLRGNSDGCNRNVWPAVFWPTPSDFPLLSEKVENIYIIIDGGTTSLSIGLATDLRYHMENVTIIGSPAGRAENYFAQPIGRRLPNSRLYFSLSMGLHVNSNSRDIALRPDVFMPLTIEDIINNRDPVLEYIRAR